MLTSGHAAAAASQSSSARNILASAVSFRSFARTISPRPAGVCVDGSRRPSKMSSVIPVISVGPPFAQLLGAVVVVIRHDASHGSFLRCQTSRRESLAPPPPLSLRLFICRQQSFAMLPNRRYATCQRKVVDCLKRQLTHAAL